MIFPKQQARRTTAAVIVTSIILAICLVVSGRIGGDTSAATVAASGKDTCFCNFRKTWNSGSDLYGVAASADKNVLTYMAYTELDNVKVKSVAFCTFDEAQSIALDATPNKELTCTTDKLANGPYILAVWFDVAENGKVTTTFDACTVYVSDGNAWFADAADLKPPAA